MHNYFKTQNLCLYVSPWLSVCLSLWLSLSAEVRKPPVSPAECCWWIQQGKEWVCCKGKSLSHTIIIQWSYTYLPIYTVHMYNTVCTVLCVQYIYILHELFVKQVFRSTTWSHSLTWWNLSSRFISIICFQATEDEMRLLRFQRKLDDEKGAGLLGLSLQVYEGAGLLGLQLIESSIVSSTVIEYF